MKDGRIKRRAADGLILKPPSGRKGEHEIDYGRAGVEQAELESAGPQPSSVDGDKGNGATVQHAKPGNIEDQMVKI